MEPSRPDALQGAKESTLQQTLSSEINSRPASRLALDDLSAPPAYHMVVDSEMSTSTATSPYMHDEEEYDREHDGDHTPEIVINAATQIRGHGNIISIAPMDSVRIANLITSVLNCDELDEATRPLTPPSPPSLATAPPERTSKTQVRGIKRYPNINITVNCGATVIGDRNIVGPGLGDIARQMQMAQRNQAALLAQQQQRQQAAAAAAAMGTPGQSKMASPPLQQRSSNSFFPSQPPFSSAHYATAVHNPPGSHGVATPPMSRSSSLHSDREARKRKAADMGESVAGIAIKKQRD